jgi:hypothetical protein
MMYAVLPTPVAATSTPVASPSTTNHHSLSTRRTGLQYVFLAT